MYILPFPTLSFDRNPVNSNTCAAHGPYTGLICTKCVTSLPERTTTSSGGTQ